MSRNEVNAGIFSVEDSSCGKQLIRSCLFLSTNVGNRNGYCSRSYNINKEIKFNSCLELLSNLSSGIIHQQTSNILVGETARILAELHARATSARGRSPIAKVIYPSQKIW